MNKHPISSPSLSKEYLIISNKIIDDSIDEIKYKNHNLNELVYLLRKSVKQLRAILKLLRKSYGSEFYKMNNFLLRDLNRKSTAIRNFSALIKLIELNESRTEDPKIREALILLHTRINSEFQNIQMKTDYSALFNHYESQLNKYKNQLNNLKHKGSGFSTIKTGLLKFYSEGQHLLGDCIKAPTETNLHEWRKSCKEFYYISQTLVPIWKSFINAYVKESKKLSDTLGEIHDYFELKHYILSLIDNPYDFSMLLDYVESNQSILISSAYQIGNRIYSADPYELTKLFKDLYLIYKKEHQLMITANN